jgi:hypothetical protein
LENKSIYRTFCESEKRLPLFFQTWWLDFMTNGNWDVAISTEKNGAIRAVMPFSWSKKFGKNFLLQPMLTPYLGIIFFYPEDLKNTTSKYSFENEHTSNIIDQLPKLFFMQAFNFNIEYTNWYPFYKENYQQTTRYTHILQNIKNHETIYAGFTNTLRRQINQAVKDFEIEESDDILSVFSMLKDRLNKKKVKFAVDNKTLTNIDYKLKSLNQRKILLSKNKSGEITAGLYLCWDTKFAYLLGLGMTQKDKTANSIKLLIWESIKIASNYVDNYDFEGSMAPEIERLYRMFGSIKKPYFVIKKYKNKLIKIGLNIINK